MTSDINSLLSRLDHNRGAIFQESATAIRQLQQDNQRLLSELNTTQFASKTLGEENERLAAALQLLSDLETKREATDE